MVIFRENTEDVYAGIEYKSGTPENEKVANFLREEMKAKFFEGAGLGIKPISAFGSKRLVRKAIQYAIDNGRESVTLVHKGNIMKFTEGAFRNWGYEVAREEFGNVTITEEQLYAEYKGKQPEGKIVIKDRIADIMFQMMLLRPDEFDVLATPNLNGDYLSRRGRRGSRRHGHCAGRQHRRPRRGVRGHPRHRAEVRQPEQGQPRLAAVLRRDDARVHGLEGSRRPDHAGVPGGDQATASSPTTSRARSTAPRKSAPRSSPTR